MSPQMMSVIQVAEIGIVCRYFTLLPRYSALQKSTFRTGFVLNQVDFLSKLNVWVRLKPRTKWLNSVWYVYTTTCVTPLWHYLVRNYVIWDAPMTHFLVLGFWVMPVISHPLYNTVTEWRIDVVSETNRIWNKEAL